MTPTPAVGAAPRSHRRSERAAARQRRAATLGLRNGPPHGPPPFGVGGADQLRDVPTQPSTSCQVQADAPRQELPLPQHRQGGRWGLPQGRRSPQGDPEVAARSVQEPLPGNVEQFPCFNPAGLAGALQGSQEGSHSPSYPHQPNRSTPRASRSCSPEPAVLPRRCPSPRCRPPPRCTCVPPRRQR